MSSTLSIHKQAKELRERSQTALTPDEDFESPPESLVNTAAAIGAGLLTRRCCQTLWKRYRKEDPPVNPIAEGVTWTDALMWAAAVGAAVGMARVLSRRSTTAAVRRLER